MPQLVNQMCVVCRQRIESDLEATFCPLCASPVHNDCKDPPDTGSGQCTACGSDVTDQAAIDDRLHRLEEATLERIRQSQLVGMDAQSRAYRAQAWREILIGATLTGLGVFVTAIVFIGQRDIVVFTGGPIFYGLVLLSQGISHLSHPTPPD